jgi:hypothetical protein
MSRKIYFWKAEIQQNLEGHPELSIVLMDTFAYDKSWQGHGADFSVLLMFLTNH